jgi:hypothetical protein
VEFAGSFEESIVTYISTGVLPLKAERSKQRLCFFTESRIRDIDRLVEQLPQAFPAVIPVHFTLAWFVSCNQDRDEFWRGLDNLGLARRIESLFLFPFAVFDDGGLYKDLPDASPLLAHLASVTGCLGTPRIEVKPVFRPSDWHRSIQKSSPRTSSRYDKDCISST